MYRFCFLKSTKLNRYFCKEVSIISNKYVRSYEIAESEEIDSQKIDNLDNFSKKKETNKKQKWGDETIDVKTRSMMNLSMIGALGKMTEWEIHCRGAITNGVTKEEIRAIVHVIGIYCGVPQALECFRVARKVLEDDGIDVEEEFKKK